MNVVTLNITSEKKAEESAARFEAVVHHFLRVDQKFAVHIVHRVGLDLDVDQNSDHYQDADKCEDIVGFLVIADRLACLSHDKDHNNTFCEADEDVLRSVDAEEVS